MSDWSDVKTEDENRPYTPSSVFDFSPAPMLGQAASLPESEHVFQTRPPAATLSERQRTIQACDKCRERKTKCSGDHPVCHRCTTRGLICQYSSRESRTRKPSKARLRNAVSITDLRSTSNPHSSPAGSQHGEPGRPNHRLQQYPSQEYENVRPNHPVLRRVTSIPYSPLDSRGPQSAPITTSTYETLHEAYTPPSFGYKESTYAPSPCQMPPMRFAPNRSQHSQWRDVRRVQSHSTLIGSSGGQPMNMQYGLNSPLPPLNDLAGTVLYGQFSPQSNISSPSMSADPQFQQMPPVLPFEYQPSEAKQHWGYHSDCGSTGSEPMSTAGENHMTYSPTSSEDIPEPKSRCASSLGISSPESRAFDYLQVSQTSNSPSYTHYHDADFGRNIYSVPLQDSCPSPFVDAVMGDHYVQHTMAPPLARPVSESMIHADFQMSYP